MVFQILLKKTMREPVSERFYLKVRAIKRYERGCKPRPAWCQVCGEKPFSEYL